MRIARRVALIAVALVAWELVARIGTLSPIIFPSLVSIGRELVLLVARTDRVVEAWYSLSRALLGFGAAVAVGVPLGAVAGRVRAAGLVVEPVFSATYPVPKIALFPILVFAFGIGGLSKVALVFLECLYPIVVSTAAGVRAVDRVLVWSAVNMGASPWQVLSRIVIPAAAPAIFTGFRVALPIALIVVIITEMIGSADGLGYVVMAALADLRADRMLAGAAATALIGVGLDGLLVAARRRAIFWERHSVYFTDHE